MLSSTLTNFEFHMDDEGPLTLVIDCFILCVGTKFDWACTCGV